MDPITDGLEPALERIDDFRALHDGRPLEEGVEAVLCLQEAVGIDEQTRLLVKDRIYGDERLTPGGHRRFQFTDPRSARDRMGPRRGRPAPTEG
jgi:hypothetical protein